MTNQPEPATVTFTFDEAEPWLSSNERIHWREHAKRVKYWRTLGLYKARSALAGRRAVRLAQPGPGGDVTRVRIIVTVCRRIRTRADAHNLQPTAKALIDGMTEAGIIPDDSDQYVAGVEFRAEYGVPRAIRIDITEAPDPVLARCDGCACLVPELGLCTWCGLCPDCCTGKECPC